MWWKRNTLPKNIKELLENNNIEELKGIYKTRKIDAYEKYSKRTALAFDECSHEFANWLIEEGANVHRQDRWGRTPLHNRAGSIYGNIKSLIELGVDINYKTKFNGTPLHSAARSHNVENTKLLINSNAKIDEKDFDELTPLEVVLQNCQNADIADTLIICKIYLNLGVIRTSKMKNFVSTIGENFEFHRTNFNKEYVDEYSDALDKLYELFEVTPIQRRIMHNGQSEIITKSKNWEGKFDELWELLVPSSGSAQTLQGEVIRISGKISRELDINGGINWGKQYKLMIDSLYNYVQEGNKLSTEELIELNKVIKKLKRKTGETNLICEYSVRWVDKNPKPVKLEKVNYEI